MPQPLNPVRPGTEAELTQQLADTIGADVEKAMDSVGWKHTNYTPQTPAEQNNSEQQENTTASEGDTGSDNPKPTTQAVTENAVNWDEFKDSSGKYLGKYNSPQEAVKGMHSLLHMAKTALSDRDQAVLEAGQLRQRLTVPQSTQTETTSAPVGNIVELDSIRAKLRAGEGLDSDDALRLIDGLTKHTENIVEKRVEQEKQVQRANEERWKQADDYMRQHHPRSLEFVDEMNLFKSTNSEVGRVFNRLLADANDDNARTDAATFLWKEYIAANPHVLATPVDSAAQEQDRQLSAKAQVRKEEVDQARTQAGLMGNSAGGVHQTERSEPSSEDVERAAQYMKQTADGRLWRSLTIAKDLKGPFFDE